MMTDPGMRPKFASPNEAGDPSDISTRVTTPHRRAKKTDTASPGRSSGALRGLVIGVALAALAIVAYTKLTHREFKVVPEPPKAPDDVTLHSLDHWSHEVVGWLKDENVAALNDVLKDREAKATEIKELRSEIELLKLRTSDVMTANRDSLSLSAQIRIAGFAVIMLGIVGGIVTGIVLWIRRRTNRIPELPDDDTESDQPLAEPERASHPPA